MVQPGWILESKYPCIHRILSPNMNFLGPRRMQVLENFQQFCHRFGREGTAYENPTWPEVNVGPVWASLQSTTTKRAPTLVKTRRDKEEGERGRKRREKDRRWREEKRAEASRQQTYCRGPRQAHRWFWLGTVLGMARPARRKATKEREDEHTTGRTERNRRKRTRRKEPGSACLTAAWLALSALSTLPSSVFFTLGEVFRSWLLRWMYLSVSLTGSSRLVTRDGADNGCRASAFGQGCFGQSAQLRNTIYDCRNHRIPTEWERPLLHAGPLASSRAIDRPERTVRIFRGAENCQLQSSSIALPGFVDCENCFIFQVGYHQPLAL